MADKQKPLTDEVKQFLHDQAEDAASTVARTDEAALDTHLMAEITAGGYTLAVLSLGEVAGVFKWTEPHFWKALTYTILRGRRASEEAKNLQS